MEKVRPWCDQPSDRGRLTKRTEQNICRVYSAVGPFGAVPVSGDVRGDVVAGLGAVHGAVERVEWLEHVERSPVVVEQLAEERRTTTLVRHDHHRPNAGTTNLSTVISKSIKCICLQCFEAVGWAPGRASGL